MTHRRSQQHSTTMSLKVLALGVILGIALWALVFLFGAILIEIFSWADPYVSLWLPS